MYWYLLLAVYCFCYSSEKVVKIESTIEETLENSQIVFLKRGGSTAILVRNQNGNLWRSTDGRSWEKSSVPEKMAGVHSHQITSIATNAQKNESLPTYFLSNRVSLQLWVTKDLGTTYVLIESEEIKKVVSLHPHPYDASVIALIARTDSNDCVHVSQNFGQDWTSTGCSPKPGRVYWSDHVPARLYRIAKVDGLQKLTWSTDYFKTAANVLTPTHVLNWYFVNDKLVVVNCMTDLDAGGCLKKELLISVDDGKTFLTASFPDKTTDLHEAADVYFHLLSEKDIWLSVKKYCPDFSPESKDVCWGNIYSSNWNNNFSLSLRNFKLDQFASYTNIDGIFLANQYMSAFENPKPFDTIRTVLTFNNGASWDLIPAPSLDSNGQPIGCGRDIGCGLHVHQLATTANRPNAPFLEHSIENGIGTILVTGNVGKNLVSSGEANFYCSTNGGTNWTEIRKGRHIASIGNFGGIIVAIRAQNATSVIFSVDDGRTWDTYEISSEPLLNVSILLDGLKPNSNSFLLMGHKVTDAGESHASIYFLDFSGSFTHECSTGEFSKWSPTDEHGHCFLGGVTTYQRRELGKACSYPRNYSFEKISTPCVCTELDYECESCFERELPSRPCTMICSAGAIPPPPTSTYCDADTKSSPIYYATTSGYQKIDISICRSEASVVKPNGSIPCALWKQKTEVPSWIFLNKAILIPALFIVALLIIVIIGVTWFFYKHNFAFREWVHEVMSWRMDHEYSSVSMNEPLQAFDDLESMDDDDLDLNV